MTHPQRGKHEGVLPLRVVAAIICDGQKILACRRRAEKAAGGLWEFPGGKIEPGEHQEDALVREIGEELAIPVTVTEHLGTDTTLVGHRPIELSCFRAVLTGAKPEQSSDHDKLYWIAPIELAQLEWAAPDLPVVRRLVVAAETERTTTRTTLGTHPQTAPLE